MIRKCSLKKCPCFIGCNESPGIASDQLRRPTHITFDIYGNLFVLDQGNLRIQKFQLEKNSCCK